METSMPDSVAIVFNGFLALSLKEKVKLVEVLNEFFDHPDRREQMRKNNEAAVANIVAAGIGSGCGCCRR